jgi:hypothetical protein
MKKPERCPVCREERHLDYGTFYITQGEHLCGLEAAKEQARCAEYDDALPGAYTEKVCSECGGHPEALMKRAEEAEAAVALLRVEKVVALTRTERAERQRDSALGVTFDCCEECDELSGYQETEHKLLEAERERDEARKLAVLLADVVDNADLIPLLRAAIARLNDAVPEWREKIASWREDD